MSACLNVELTFRSDEAKQGVYNRFRTARVKAEVGLVVLGLLLKLVTPEKVEDPVLVITALAAFTNPDDPWTTTTALSSAQSLLSSLEEMRRRNNGSLTDFSGDILSRFVKPSFSKTKTPSITAEGRKVAHPVKQPRFDPSIFDKGSKPWKHKDVYIMTVLSWVIQQYTVIELLSTFLSFPAC